MSFRTHVSQVSIVGTCGSHACTHALTTTCMAHMTHTTRFMCTSMRQTHTNPHNPSIFSLAIDNELYEGLHEEQCSKFTCFQGINYIEQFCSKSYHGFQAGIHNDVRKRSQLATKFVTQTFKPKLSPTYSKPSENNM